MCELYDLFILNGVNSLAAYTCHTSRGESTVDYILCSKLSIQVKHTPLQACKITDHDLLFATLPMRQSRAQQPAQTAIHSQGIHDTETAASGNAANNTSYQWVEGTCLKEYGTSTVIWK